MNRIDRVELQGLAWHTPLGAARIARAVLAGVVAQATPGRMTLDTLELDELTLEGITVEMPVAAAARAAGPPWRCEPAAGMDGEIRASITDAAWVLDADVTVAVERGRVDFNRVAVEHIGPDSAMGLGRTGVHVDAPNGRTDLFRWSTPAVPGARYEQRGSMLKQVTDRGALELQPIFEALLAGVALGAPAAGTRELLARTRLAGHLRLGDGVVGNDRQRVTLTGRGEGCNRVELSSMPSGQGFGLHLVELSAGDLRIELAGRVATAATLRGTLTLHLKDPAGKPQIAAKVPELVLRDLAVRPSA